MTVLTGQMQALTTIEFTPDGSKMLVSERGQHFVVYDTKTWRMSKLVKAHRMLSGTFRPVETEKSGHRIQDKTVRVWILKEN